MRQLAVGFALFILTSNVANVARAQDHDLDAVRAAKRATAVRISQPIRLDGILDEPAWELATPIGDFYQQYPDEFKPATRPTEVRFLYDDTTLYIGAMNYDDEPDTLVINDLKRDFGALQTEALGFAFDTFRDRQNAYGFQINPGGAMRDTLATENGRSNDSNWDGVWNVRTAILPNGWSLEMALPFKTLRFPDQATQLWNVNVVRTSRYINERSTWSPVPQQFSHYNTAFAGTLEGIAGVQPGRNLYVKPFATADLVEGGIGKTGWSGDRDGGVDLKWGMTSSLTLDATWRTDFSQVEADEQQINLTRFNLFFPEKRQFFLESPASFQVGVQEMNGRRDLLPFFSRNIGLAGGQPVPVVGGLRLTGRVGRQSLGLLNMQTESFGGRPADNFTAMVLKRAVSATTSVGGFYFGRESGGTTGFNRVGGVDFRFKPRRTLDIEAFAMRSGTDGQKGDWAGRAGFLLDTSHHRARAALLHVGDDFRHDLGFVRRRGIGSLYGEYSFLVRPANRSGRVLQHSIGGNVEVTGNDRYSQLLTQIGGATYTMSLVDGTEIKASVQSTFEHLDTSFGIGASLKVPVGEYRFNDVELAYSSDPSKQFSGGFTVNAGEFWTGRQRAVRANLRYRLNAHLAASTTLDRSIVTLPQGSFTGDLLGLRVDTSFSRRMFLNAFIQYNGELDAWLSNVRFNLIHRPLSDIYVLWNETRLPTGAQRALLMKYTHLLAF